MASPEIERLRTAIARRTTTIKDLLEDPDRTDLSISIQIADAVAEMQNDVMFMVRELQERRLEDYDRDRDRFEDRYDDRGRDSRSSRDDRDDRGRGGRDSGRDGGRTRGGRGDFRRR